jgi:cell division protein FtsW
MSSADWVGVKPRSGFQRASRRTATVSRRQRIRYWLKRLLIVGGLLAAAGLIASFSTTVFLNIALDRPAYAGFWRHGGFLLAGTVLAIIAVQLITRCSPARRWLRFVVPGAFYLSLILVLLVQVGGLGMEVNGARRFLDLGFVQFQPSELLKISLVLYLAQLLCWWRRSRAAEGESGPPQTPGEELDEGNVEQRPTWTEVAQSRPGVQSFRLLREGRPVWPELPKRCVLIVVLAFGLTAIQPDLGSAAIILGCSLLTFVLAGVDWRQLLSFALLLVVAGSLALGLMRLVDEGRYAYAADRISTWAASITSPAPDEDGPAYQLTQARGALAAGGLWGRGFLHSDQKMNRLPLSTNDFVFPVLVEELGFIGGLSVILLFLALGWVAVRLSFCCRDTFNRTVIAALGFSVCLQAFVNIGVTIGTLPLSGLTLPFFSAGGTSLLVSVLAIGLMYALAASEARPQPA